jgi:hypothetical protein
MAVEKVYELTEGASDGIFSLEKYFKVPLALELRAEVLMTTCKCA